MSSIGKITGTVCRLTHNDGIKRLSLIYKFTTFTGCYPKEKTKDDIFNPKRIRADISHIKKKVSIFGESYIPKFSPIELSSVRYMTQDICPRSLD